MAIYYVCFYLDCQYMGDEGTTPDFVGPIHTGAPACWPTPPKNFWY